MSDYMDYLSKFKIEFRRVETDYEWHYALKYYLQHVNRTPIIKPSYTLHDFGFNIYQAHIMCFENFKMSCKEMFFQVY